MFEEWVQIDDFEDYAVSDYGNIKNLKTNKLVALSHTKQGAIKVGIVAHGKQYTRSVKVLVATIFVEKTDDAFDTPIHLDGDQDNCVASNLMWRTRGFAWQYHHQFNKIEFYEGIGPIVDRHDNTVYQNVAEAAITNGLLMHDIYIKAHYSDRRAHVYPTWQVFEYQ